MSRASNPCDNAAIESFVSTLHFELPSRKRFETFENARAVITEWIESFYNTERRHTTIGNARPIKHEFCYQMRQKMTYSTCPRNRGRLKSEASSDQHDSYGEAGGGIKAFNRNAGNDRSVHHGQAVSLMVTNAAISNVSSGI